jgi:type IV secretory pathway TrbF-like protein
MVAGITGVQSPLNFLLNQVYVTDSEVIREFSNFDHQNVKLPEEDYDDVIDVEYPYLQACYLLSCLSDISDDRPRYYMMILQMMTIIMMMMTSMTMMMMIMIIMWLIPARKLIVFFVFQSDNLGDRMKVRMKLMTDTA